MESVMKFQKSDASAFSSMKTLMHSSSKHGDNANILRALTMQVLKTYQRCNPSFKPHEKYPQRILTHPSEGVQNNGFDNCEANLICKVHDSLICNDDVYTILDLLGTGTFGQVFRCQKNGTTEVFAVKVIKNKQAYHAQGLLEIKIAKLLNKNYDATAQNYVVRYFDSFEFKGHVCIIFELLSISLLDILTQNQFRGLPLTVVQRFTIQIMHAMVQLQDANIIHCDLKPENILLTPPQQRQSISRDSGDDEKTLLTSSNDTEDEMNSKTSLMSAPNNFNDWSNIKVIDFGSACFEGHTMYSYIQSRFCKSVISNEIPLN
jgi:dual specificity protein kinase YAK1